MNPPVDPEGFIRFQAVQQERAYICDWLRKMERFPGELRWIILSLMDEEHLSSE